MPMSENHALPVALIVDDDYVMRMLERETLAQFGFEVIEAEDGEQVLAMFDQSPPNLVLLDVEMPGIDGFEVCKRLRQIWDMTRVPVIMVTGMDDLTSINRAYDSGANDFVAKPINWPILGHRARYVWRSAQAARQLNELREKQTAIMQAIPDMIFVMDRHGTYLDYKEGFGTTALVPPSQFLGKNMASILPAETATLIQQHIDNAVSQGSLQSVVYKLPLADGVHHYEGRIAPNGSDKVVIVVRDITAQKLNEDRIRRLAYFDTLTGMPNRQSFLERLDSELLRASRNKRRVALLFLDLDGFKRINDTLGHTVGDYLLQAVAERMKEKLRTSDFISRPALDDSSLHFARLGGDEFTVVLPDVDEVQTVSLVAARLQALLSQPFVIGNQDITVTSSIGIAIFPADGEDGATLLKHADTAMYHAKDQGRNNWQMYDQSLTTRTSARLALESDIRKGLERGEFYLLYQPQVNAESGEIVGVEALIRWQHPEHGIVSPAQFIPVAEESGLIVPMGEWVLNEACSQIVRWQARAVHAPRVAVNISARQLRSANFLDKVATTIAATGIAPERLELELTESILMDPEARQVQGLYRLRQLGVHFSIDDFGTGYSSLSYIKRFPIGMLKIDQSFVRGLPDSINDAGIATAVIAMARNMQLEVIAEGVETPAQLDFLRQAQCPKVQGYLFSRPLPADEAEKLLHAGRIVLPESPLVP
ncbi:MAG TPA: EAL domain-containing protein [Accumulibacter sp.]|nr:EAL domain-containing protein [Accumulibacter sp.]HNJ99773.1 EAL domain-containing protein [Accumulibacter sp.]HNL12856.1 EAL domain-containing protein [Accumulibacter sp.]HNL78664.1 EAL domain-containing protein [Accumulibacter sp.]